MVKSILLMTLGAVVGTVLSTDVVEVSKIIKVADEQKKQGFIQTAKVLRELVEE